MWDVYEAGKDDDKDFGLVLGKIFYIEVGNLFKRFSSERAHDADINDVDSESCP